MSIREIHWEISNKCNLNCKHCLIDAGKGRDDELELDDCLKALDKFSESGVEIISFTGGEPFCKTGFRSIIEKTLKLGIKAQIITNSLLINDEWYVFIRDNNIPIGVSLDGYDKETNDYIRGEGTYDKIIGFLEKAQKLGIITSLYVTATQNTIDHFNDVFSIAKKYGCVNVHVNDLTEDGRHTKNADYSIPHNNEYLLKQVSDASKEVFDEVLTDSIGGCWASGKCLLVTGNGNIYRCTELKRLYEKRPIGNILSFPLQKWFEDNEVLDYLNYECCYHEYYNSCVSLTINKPIPCALSYTAPEINTLEELYAAFDKLNEKCNEVCSGCNYPDCKGYIWLTPTESERLIDNDIDVITVNDNIDLIYSFCDKDGNTDMSIRQPECIHRNEDGSCRIHSIRPLVCHMYPIGPDTVNGHPMWVLHKSCKFTMDMIDNKEISSYIHEAQKIINNISDDLAAQINQIYDYMNYLSSFPDGENSCIVICEIRN